MKSKHKRLLSENSLDTTNFDEFKKIQRSIFLAKADLPVLYKKNHTSSNDYIAEISNISRHIWNESPQLIQLFERSTLHVVYRIDVSAGSFVIRIYKGNNLYLSNSFLIEEKLLQYLSSNGIPVSHIVRTDTSRSIIPYSFQISKFVEGESLFDLSKKQSIDNYIFETGKVAAYLHQIVVNRFGPWSVSNQNLIGIYKNWSTYILKNLQQHVAYCQKNNILDKKNILKIVQIFENNRSLISQNITPVVLHGDLANHNIVVQNGKITALIDWEDSIAGDPIYDIAYYASGIYKNKIWLKRFFSGYEMITPIADTAIFQKKYYLYFLRISLAKAIIRHKTSKTESADLPNIQERILYAIDHCA